jgi:hypothetical protein
MSLPPFDTIRLDTNARLKRRRPRRRPPVVRREVSIEDVPTAPAAPAEPPSIAALRSRAERFRDELAGLQGALDDEVYANTIRVEAAVHRLLYQLERLDNE